MAAAPKCSMRSAGWTTRHPGPTPTPRAAEDRCWQHTWCAGNRRERVCHSGQRRYVSDLPGDAAEHGRCRRAQCRSPPQRRRSASGRAVAAARTRNPLRRYRTASHRARLQGIGRGRVNLTGGQRRPRLHRALPGEHNVLAQPGTEPPGQLQIGMQRHSGKRKGQAITSGRGTSRHGSLEKHLRARDARNHTVTVRPAPGAAWERAGKSRAGAESPPVPGLPFSDLRVAGRAGHSSPAEAGNGASPLEQEPYATR